MYIHIEDSSKGTGYAADVDSIDYKDLDLTKTNSVDIAYSSEKDTFTYVIDGSKITITNKYKDDDENEKTETIEGTIASDKKSFTITETDDGETVTTTYTKVDKAPSNATLIIKVAGSSGGETGGSETKTVNATWNFSTSPENFPTSDAAADAITALPVAANSGSGATLTATGRWKFNSGLQEQETNGVTVSDVNADSWIGSADKAKYLTLTLDSSAKVTVVFSVRMLNVLQDC